MARAIQLLTIATLVSLLGPDLTAQDRSIREKAIGFEGWRPEGIIAPVVPSTIDAGSDQRRSSLENTRIYRAQIKIRTADRDDAGQNDGAKVRLNAANETLLAPGQQEFTRGKTYTYDLLQIDSCGAPVLTKLSDIQMLEISKTGRDGWCFSDLELIINGRTIYRATYPQGQWLDNSGGARLVHTISGATMRKGALWAEYTPPNPSPLLAQAESGAKR